MMTKGMALFGMQRALKEASHYAFTISKDIGLPSYCLSTNKLDAAALEELRKHPEILVFMTGRMVFPVETLCVFELVSNPDFPTSVDVLSVMGMVSGDSRQYTLRQSLDFLERGMLATGCSDVDFSASDALIEWLTVRSKRNPKKLAGRTKDEVLKWLTRSTSNKLLSEVAIIVGEYASRSDVYRDLFQQDFQIESEVNRDKRYADRAKHSQDLEVLLSGQLSEAQLLAMARNTVTRQYVNDMWAAVRGEQHVAA